MILKETILSVFNERGTLLKWLKTVERLITERVLVKPVNNPQSTEIVAVDSTGEQVMLEVGTGLTIDNGTLKFANVYDGTVIIEKAGLRGLRKFNDMLIPASIPVKGDAVADAEKQVFDINATLPFMDAMAEASGDPNAKFTVKQIFIYCFDNDGDPTILQVGYVVEITDGVITGENVELPLYNYLKFAFNGKSPWLIEDYANLGVTQEDLQRINILEPPESKILEEWLLANTEGVSV